MTVVSLLVLKHNVMIIGFFYPVRMATNLKAKKMFKKELKRVTQRSKKDYSSLAL